MPRMFKYVWNPVIFIHDINPLIKEFLFTVEKDMIGVQSLSGVMAFGFNTVCH